MTAITNNYVYNITCKVCDVIRKLLVTAFVAVVAFGENAGRARAAHQLASMGLHEEAKALMLQKTEETKYDV